MMIRRTLFISLVAATVASAGVTHADEDTDKMLKVGEKWLKHQLENNSHWFKLDIPDRYKLDLPEGVQITPKKFGYTWGDYDAWVSPFKPLDRLQWKQEFDGGHREFELNNDGFYFKYKKVF